ncbi:Conserved hypothetical protein [gamma proteobacterium HdN1]|nr:Conserved hypothetical protein [gamma proteobacterium HdN1]
MTTPLHIAFDNTYARELPDFYRTWKPTPAPAPKCLFFNDRLARTLGLDFSGQSPQALAAFFSGNQLPDGAFPLAQVYAGHQFGGFSPQLGDGRALLIGEILTPQGARYDLAFKGSGRTPFSRNGDGKAALGPMLREALISEALHALGIPTTRTLAVIGTGEPVYRETVLPGANLTRIAASHIRVGTFEYFAARGETQHVKALTDYTIARHYPELTGSRTCYLDLLAAVCERQAALVAQWQHVGFIHGVMNTDNMTLSGETIDFGPCAFMEAFDPNTVFSSIDRQGRYAYGNQPSIAQWNLARLAETLLPLLAERQEEAIALATEIIHQFPEKFARHWLQGARRKLGFETAPEQEREQAQIDLQLTQDWLALLQKDKADFTLSWRALADAAEGNLAPLQAQIHDREALQSWVDRWKLRCAEHDHRYEHTLVTPSSALESSCDARRANAIRAANPWIIPRNQRVEEALTAASESGDLSPFETLLEALRHPFEENSVYRSLAQPATAAFTSGYRTFCGT